MHTLTFPVLAVGLVTLVTLVTTLDIDMPAHLLVGDVKVALLPSVYFIAVLIVGLTFARFWRVKMAPRYREEITND